MTAKLIAELTKCKSGFFSDVSSKSARFTGVHGSWLEFERRQYDKSKHFQSNPPRSYPPGIYAPGPCPVVYAECILSNLVSKKLWRHPDVTAFSNLFGHVKPSHYEGVITEAFNDESLTTTKKARQMSTGQHMISHTESLPAADRNRNP